MSGEKNILILFQTLSGERFYRKDFTEDPNAKIGMDFVVDFHSANLRGTDFSEATLLGAIFVERNLSGTIVIRTIMSFANLSETIINKANLYKANLTTSISPQQSFGRLA